MLQSPSLMTVLLITILSALKFYPHNILTEIDNANISFKGLIQFLYI